MHNYEIKSKAYCPAKRKEKILIIGINCAIILFALISVFSIMVDGPSINNVSGCILSVVFEIGLRIAIHKRPEYIFCILQISVDTDLISISYYPYVRRRVNIQVKDIETLQYSDRLKCLKISGNNSIEEEKNISNSNELLLYIDYDENKKLCEEIELLAHKTIFFVDR